MIPLYVTVTTLYTIVFICNQYFILFGSYSAMYIIRTYFRFMYRHVHFPVVLRMVGVHVNQDVCIFTIAVPSDTCWKNQFR